MADLVDALLARPGLYLGPQIDPTGEHGSGAARIQVSALPGGSGVMFDYEVLHPDGRLGHREHAMVMRTTGAAGAPGMRRQYSTPANASDVRSNSAAANHAILSRRLRIESRDIEVANAVVPAAVPVQLSVIDDWRANARSCAD